MGWTTLAPSQEGLAQLLRAASTPETFEHRIHRYGSTESVKTVSPFAREIDSIIRRAPLEAQLFSVLLFTLVLIIFTIILYCTGPSNERAMSSAVRCFCVIQEASIDNVDVVRVYSIVGQEVKLKTVYPSGWKLVGCSSPQVVSFHPGLRLSTYTTLPSLVCEHVGIETLMLERLDLEMRVFVEVDVKGA